ncbi:MAG: hypothetical protein Q8Q09_23440 [Deltaproteobacteria bacterium]|nr:hypothetical protein [Deltaproteobacteria bacterium]
MNLSGPSLKSARKQAGLSREQLCQLLKLVAVDAAVLARMEAQETFEADEEFADRLGESLRVPWANLLAKSSAPADAVREGGVQFHQTVHEHSPFERALRRVQSDTDHRAEDRFVVESTLRHVDMGFIHPRDLDATARAWLDAAAFLRTQRVLPTFVTLAGSVAALDGFAGEHAQKLIALARVHDALVPENERQE